MQESLEASFVRIRTADGRIVGAGFLVGEGHLLPCTHVAGQTLDVADPSGELPQAEGCPDFPFTAPGRRATASGVLWPAETGR